MKSLVGYSSLHTQNEAGCDCKKREFSITHLDNAAPLKIRLFG